MTQQIKNLVRDRLYHYNRQNPAAKENIQKKLLLYLQQTDLKPAYLQSVKIILRILTWKNN